MTSSTRYLGQQYRHDKGEAMSKPDNKSNAIAARLKIAREQAGLSQGQVAKLLRLHRPSISEAEAGRRRVTAEELAEFARVYGVSITWLVNGDSELTEADEAQVQVVARELARLSSEDLDKVLRLLKSVQKDAGGNK
jgi:transcriptional regulator with XRE-family HTH domain